MQQPSQYDIQREVEALRDLRRRSTTPGALAIDPDLPNQASPTSPTTAYFESPTSNDSADPGSSTGSSSNLSSPVDDPFHLFWVPASVHPEIAPAEFRAFLKEHSRNPPTDGLERSPSTGLGRKKSMLSRQYQPKEHDGVEEETVVPLKRNRSSLVNAPQLTIGYLQQLEELAEKNSDDPTKLRNILRRSLSLNVSPTAVERMEDIPDMPDEADAPIIVPPPGQILRRAARTKIRKPGLPGDGGGHRFSTTRRGQGRSGTAPPSIEERLSSDRSSSDHGDSLENVSPTASRTGALSSESFEIKRPDSFSEEGLIYDAYARDDDESQQIITESPPQSVEDLTLSTSPSEVNTSLLDALGPVIQHPQPQRMLSPQPPPDQPQQPSRTPSPSELSTVASSEYSLHPSQSPPRHQQPSAVTAGSTSPPSSTTPIGRKEKDKKGLFGKWGGDKSSKKGKEKEKEKEKDREGRDRSEKEKESSFFSSLFGSKKTKDHDQSSQSMGGQGSQAGREAAQALLGGSKAAKSFGSPSSPANQQLPPGVNNYSRYPIHVERAIYRLSHIKLANPRRPLYEQVLISNLMFWYLGVINKAQTTGVSAVNGQPQQPSQIIADGVIPDQEKNQREQAEQAEKERLEQEQREKERLEAERREREREAEMMKKKESSTRRGSLTKVVPGGPSRRAEMPIKGPQYEMQHRVMEQEYNGFVNNSQQPILPRMKTSPVNSQYQRPYNVMGSPTQEANPMPDHFYYSSNEPVMHNPQPYRLPPGAMPPVDQQTGWLSQSQPNVSPTRTTSASPPRPQSPEHHDSSTTQQHTQPRLPTRSQSATVTPSPQINGKIRKGTSAYAGVPSRPRDEPNGIANEEEDVPLAVWQQQRRR